MHGALELGGTGYLFALLDATDDGIYSLQREDYGENVEAGDMILVDANTNGRLDGRHEAYDVRQSFFVDGRPFRVTHIEPGGQSVRIREQEASTVLVIVRDERQTRPLDAATISVAPWLTATTDKLGCARLRLPTGRFLITAQAPRHIPELKEIVVGDQTDDGPLKVEFSLVEIEHWEGMVSLHEGDAHKFLLNRTTLYEDREGHDQVSLFEIGRKADLTYHVRRGRHSVAALGGRSLIPLGEVALDQIPDVPALLGGKRACEVEAGHSYVMQLPWHTRPDVLATTMSVTHYIVFNVLEVTEECLLVRWKFAERQSPDAKLFWASETDEEGP
jgi:hypothetical protein